MKTFTIYTSNTYQDKFNKTYPNVMTVHRKIDLQFANNNDYVMAEFKDNHRSKDTFIKSDVLFADFDGEVSLEEFRAEYKQYAWILCTSKNHQKDKDGVIADRFHVLFPVGYDMKKDEMETFLQKLIHKTGCDLKCKDVSRFFYGNKDTEVISNLDGEYITTLLDTIDLPEDHVEASPVFTYNNKTEMNKAVHTMVANAAGRVTAAHKGSRNSTLYANACFLRKLENGGFNISGWRETLVESAMNAELDISEIANVMKSAQRITDKITYEIKSSEEKKQERRESKIEQSINWLRDNYDFRYDTLLSQTQFKEKGAASYQELDDIEINTILNKINSTVCISKQSLMSTIESKQVLEFYDPIANYFNSLPEDDQKVDYITQFANTVQTANQETFVRLFKRWFVSSVGQMLGECTNHSVLIFIERKGGTGKSTWLRRLSPINEVYEGTVDVNSKDSLRMLSNKTHIILDELEATTRKSDFQALKSLVTREDICMREPYARKEKRFTRRTSFCGTTNNHIVINESEGSRRWLTFEIADMDNPINYKFDPELLKKAYAQAYRLYREGFEHWFNTDDINTIMLMNEEFTVPNTEEQALEQFVSAGEEWYSAFSIIEHLTKNTPVKLNPKKLSESMKRIGYPSKRTNKGRLYQCSLINSEEYSNPDPLRNGFV